MPNAILDVWSFLIPRKPYDISSAANLLQDGIQQPFFRLTDNGAMSSESQLLSFSSILSNHSMRSVEVLQLSRVCGESLKLFECTRRDGKFWGNNKMENWWVKIQGKKKTGTIFHLYKRSLLFQNVSNTTNYENKRTTNWLATSLIILCCVSF